jgi:diguanylate cyclase (GGDEF)-like protein
MGLGVAEWVMPMPLLRTPARGRGWSGRDRDAPFWFGVRLLLTLAVTFVVIGVGGYAALNARLERQQVRTYAQAQRADVQSFKAIAAGTSSQERALAKLQVVLDAFRRRGAREALLIDESHVIRAATDRRLVGRVGTDSRIVAALDRGTHFSGHAQGKGGHARDFEFVQPLDLDGERYAYELSYGHRTYDARMREIRLTLAMLGLAALLFGSLLFYLVGGRSLIRSHRFALQRATRDGLTDLPNQRAFEEDLPRAVASADRYGEPLALAVLDVDDFKFANDRHGHQHGDELLRRLADALGSQRAGDRAYRTGGDEFTVLLPRTDAAGARAFGKRLQGRLTSAGVDVSVGTATLEPGKPPDLLRSEADVALYEAKRQGGKRIVHYDSIQSPVTVTSSHKRQAVRRLIEEGRLQTLFQPIWDLGDGTLLGLEALTRFDPSYELDEVAEVFDIAEQLGRVHALDVLCVQSALSAAAELPPEGRLFINISPQTLDLDADRNDWLRVAVLEAGLPLERVVVEVTERFRARTTAVVKCLQRLRAQGFKVAIDDVGTGNSGLEMLSQIGADYVKLDRSIVAAAPTEPNARAVLVAMAAFARQTGAFVIAEGVEDDGVLDYLRSLDGDLMRADTVVQGGQGYGLGRPNASARPETPGAFQVRPPRIALLR